MYFFLARIRPPHYNTRCISTSVTANLIQKWREEKGLPMNPNASSILTDGADYTYLDGRPTPYGARQKKRLVKQKEIAERIIKLTSEVDFAVERYKQIQIDEQNRRKEMIGNKLKPKGAALLKHSK